MCGGRDGRSKGEEAETCAGDRGCGELGGGEVQVAGEQEGYREEEVDRAEGTGAT